MSANLENPKEGVRDLRCRVLVAGVGGGACSVLGHSLAGWTDPPMVAAIVGPHPTPERLRELCEDPDLND